MDIVNVITVNENSEVTQVTRTKAEDVAPGSLTANKYVVPGWLYNESESYFYPPQPTDLPDWVLRDTDEAGVKNWFSPDDSA